MSERLDLGAEALSKIIIFSKYAKYIPDLKRRETWDEIVDRYEVMMMKKYPNLRNEIIENAKFIRDKKVLPSMRALQFAGSALEVNNARGYNCCFLPIDSLHSFSETMFLLLGGTGVGYSVQKHHIDQLPEIKIPKHKRKYVVQDSIIGWADSIKALMKAYLLGSSLPDFDYSDVRPKGARLITAGGKAPGPEPLKICIAHVSAILERKKEGEKLTTLECHDILCHIANSVLSGGIRRSAMISLFSLDDEEMLTCKYGNWWELNEQRGRANNSAIILRGSINEDEFKELWKKIELSGCGEPGIYWTNNLEWGTNPCCEIALRPYQFCNLCEINVSNIISEYDLSERAKVASFFGTLQAGFTDFHYLRNIWRKTTEQDALLGIGMTGIASKEVLKYNLSNIAEVVKLTNIHTADLIKINHAARTTCVKPSGTTSCVLGTSSGIHAWHNDYFLRTSRYNMNEDIAKYMLSNHPEMCELDALRPKDTLCVRIPIKAPNGSILRTESAIDLLERVKKISIEWVKEGHVDGDNTHNVSTTVSINKSRKYGDISIYGLKDTKSFYDEWEVVGKWMWENKDIYNGLSVLNYDGGSFTQAPFEDITEEEYNKRIESISNINLTNIIEEDDKVDFGQTEACANGKCEIV